MAQGRYSATTVTFLQMIISSSIRAGDAGCYKSLAP